jgi:hypothetical protein
MTKNQNGLNEKFTGQNWSNVNGAVSSLQLNEATHHEDMWKVEIQLHTFLTSALYGGNCLDAKNQTLVIQSPV